jgi:methylthioribose-1-phosphate isomerase
MRIYTYLLPKTIHVALVWYGFEHMVTAFQSAKTCQLAGFLPIRNTSTTTRALKKYNMDDTVRRKDVVTSFIRKRKSQDSQWEFLLVQRSDEVSTYKYPYWGAVSGGVERGDKDLASRALQEIVEEVGYTREDVEYVYAGRPLYVDDNDRHFKVHPFLFTLKRVDKPVTLNWENVDARFFTEDALAKVTPMVPLLLETLETLQMDPDQRCRYAVVLEDRTHGAAELCLIALDQLRDDASSLRCQTVEEMRVWVQNFGYMLATCRPNMAPVGNAIASVLGTWISNSNATDVDTAFGDLLKLIEKEKENIIGTNARVMANAIAHLDSITKGNATMSIFTLSFSSSIRDAIRGLIVEHPLVDFNVFVCESRPLFEGVNLGLEFLGSARTKVHLVTEAQMNSVFSQHTIDAVVVGADSLFKTSFVNKVGTMQLALVARYHKVPHVVVIADVSKATTLKTFESEEKNAEEVTQAWVQGKILEENSLSQFSIPNRYFEEIPLELVTDVISGEGRISPEDIETCIDDLRELYMIAFR